MKEDFEIGIKFTLFGFIVHPIRRSVSNEPIFKDQNLFRGLRKRPDLVFVPTLEDFPQAIRPFPQTVMTSRLF